MCKGKGVKIKDNIYYYLHQPPSQFFMACTDKTSQELPFTSSLEIQVFMSIMSFLSTPSPVSPDSPGCSDCQYPFCGVAEREGGHFHITTSSLTAKQSIYQTVYLPEVNYQTCYLTKCSHIAGLISVNTKP